jgi:eukaryotic-like serine/threonine-protein kinase
VAELKPASSSPTKNPKEIRTRDPLRTLSPSALGFGSVPGTPEEARAHVQARLRAYSALFAGLWSLVLVAQVLLHQFFDAKVLRNSVLPIAMLPQLACVMTLGVSTLILSGRTLKMHSLDVFDAVLTKVQSVALIVVHVGAGEPQFRTELVIMLAATNLLAARAALVPCTAWRTAAFGVATMIAQPFATYWVHTNRPQPEGFPSPLSLALFIGVWGAIAVLSSVVVTKVIYGLERRVQQSNQLGQYTLEKRVGLGGMGVVYLAKHALLRRPTAIKLLPPGKAGSGAIKRFEREVQLTSQIEHPNVVNIYDYGRTPDGVFYYAMEYLDGFDLDRLVGKYGRLPPARVRHIVRQVAEGLAEAHAIKLIHRDVKPANIVVLNKGRQHDRVKVLDFGLVKEVKAKKMDPSLSNMGALVGTPLYLAPESITAPDKVDHRSDIYALGAVAYYLLTGGPFIKGRTMVEICAAHMYEKPESPSLRIGKPVPKSLETIILKCLEKSPDARPQSASELVDALDNAEGVEVWTNANARAAWAETPPASEKKPPQVIDAAPDSEIEEPAPASRSIPIDLSGR